MWRDIFVTNREAIAEALKLYGATFAEFQRMVEAGDMDRLENDFQSRPRDAGKAQMKRARPIVAIDGPGRRGKIRGRARARRASLGSRT